MRSSDSCTHSSFICTVKEGYALGDSAFVVEKTPFQTILNLKDNDRPALVRQIYEGFDCCAERDIKTVCERPKRNLADESKAKLKPELRVVVPSSICTTEADKDELNRIKRQMDAIRSVEKQSRWNIFCNEACVALGYSMQSLDKDTAIVSTPQDAKSDSFVAGGDNSVLNRSMMARLKNCVDTGTTDGDMSMSFSAMSLAGSNNAKSTSILSSKPDSDVKQGTVIVVPTKILPASVHAGETSPPSVNTVCNDQSHHQGLPTMSTQPLPELVPASLVATTQRHRTITSVSTLL